jgi:exosortase
MELRSYGCLRAKNAVNEMNPVAVLEKPRAPRLGLATWTHCLPIAALCFGIYASIAWDLGVEWWTVPSSSYGLLLPPLALYIAHLKRGHTLALPAEPTLQGLWLVGLACVMVVAGELAAEFFLARISMVVILAGLTWTFWGWRRLRSLAFPFVLLTTMVPLPTIVYNSIAAPLQLFASRASTGFAQALGISIFCQGNVIILANTSLGVAEACSGLQSLSALLVGALLLGFLENASLLGRILLFLLAIPLAIAVNVLRVTGTAILADYRLEWALGFYHSFSGWLVFVMGFGALWLVGKVVFRWTKVGSQA